MLGFAQRRLSESSCGFGPGLRAGSSARWPLPVTYVRFGALSDAVTARAKDSVIST